MIWIILYILFAIASGVVWFYIFKEFSEDFEKGKTVYNVKWTYVILFPVLIATSIIGLTIGVLVAEDEEIEMLAFTIKGKDDEISSNR